MKNSRRLELQRQGLYALTKQGEPKFTDVFFPYTSGQIGPYYIQSVVVEKDGNDYTNSINSLCEIIEGTIGINNFDIIGGGESRDWDFSNPVAFALKKPHIKVYKDGKVLGADPNGKRVIWVADLNNEGSSMKEKWYPTISQNHGEIIRAFFYVDRREDGVQVLKDLNLESTSVVPLDENAWQFLLDISYISSGLYNSLNRRMEDRTTWAENMLRSDAGLEKLADLLNFVEKKNRAKGEKILNIGYPNIREELLESMRSKKLLMKFSDKELLPEPFTDKGDTVYKGGGK